MTRSFPWDEPVEYVSHDSSSSNSSNPLPSSDIHVLNAATDINSEAVLLKRAEMYQDFMKQIPIPTRRGSAIPFTSWMGLGESIKKLYGQPLHYLTNVLLKEWDQLRIGSPDEYKPLDDMVHPVKAEASIWLIEEVHRQTSSHLQIAKLWKVDATHNSFIDSIIPTSEHAF